MIIIVIINSFERVNLNTYIHSAILLLYYPGGKGAGKDPEIRDKNEKFLSPFIQFDC
jgi:hypothetical protein